MRGLRVDGRLHVDVVASQRDLHAGVIVLQLMELATGKKNGGIVPETVDLDATIELPAPVPPAVTFILDEVRAEALRCCLQLAGTGRNSSQSLGIPGRCA